MHRSNPRRGRRTGLLVAVGTVGVLAGGAARADVVPNHVRDVKVRAHEGATEIEVVGTGVPTYSARVAEGGKRLIVDLSGADVAGAPEAITTPTGVVGGVFTQAYKTDAGTVARVSIGLT